MDLAKSIALDSMSNVYVTGRSIGNSGTDCTTVIYNTNGVQQFALRYDSSVNNDASGVQICLDKSYNIYVLGNKTINPPSDEDILLLKYSQPVGIISQNSEIPIKYHLSQNYPNPFNPTTTIKYSIPRDTKVIIKIYDILGREVRTLVNDFQKTGFYETKFDGSNIASGIYFYKIIAGDFIQSRKMVLVK